MDARVNDFFSEVDEIAPLNESNNENLWEKCFDEESGYHYYWNTQTDKVSWDPPPGYRSSNESKSRSRKVNHLYMPPRTAPVFSSTSGILPPNLSSVKIYKIGESAGVAVSSNITPTTSVKKPAMENDKVQPARGRKRPTGKPTKKNSDSEDERIILISSYGDESESEGESKKKQNIQAYDDSLLESLQYRDSQTNDSVATSDDDDEDYSDMLTKIQKRAKELKEMECKTATLKPGPRPEPPPPNIQKSLSKNKTKLTLVAGYSDSEEDEEQKEEQQHLENDSSFYIPPTSPNQEKVYHSTLFPAAKAIDIKDFENVPQPSKAVEESTSIDSKAFQRKRRIGVALINTGKRSTDNKEVVDNSERRGLGFPSEKPGGKNAYSNFKSGGISFIKTDVLNPSQDNDENEESTSNEARDGKVLKEIDTIYVTLKEKLGFLSEGNEPVSPVQAMLIQAETLHDALKSGDLRERYLLKWLNDNCKDLIKLEKEAAPEGWVLQWDRYHKRYYYQNATTGESQWEYPQPDVTRCDEAMDICTTPPRSSEPLSPPLPPHIGPELSPPPPPVISDFKPPKSKKRKHEKEKLPPLPADKYGSNGEPLPPGVDIPEPPAKENADMSDELSSFYSDIAAFDTKSEPTSSSQETSADLTAEKTNETVKKKKKDKVKLTQGIAMKRKGVSKLVEKWKNIQTQL